MSSADEGPRRRPKSKRQPEIPSRKPADILALTQQVGRVGVFEWSRAADRVRVTEELETMLGIVSGTFEDCRRQWSARVPAEDRDRLEAAAGEWLSSGVKEFVGEFRLLRGNEACWFEARARAAGPRGAASNVLGTILDITGRKQAEQELERTRSALAQAGELAQLGAWWVDLDDRENLNANPLRWSDEVYRVFGYEPGEIAVTNDIFFDHVPSEDRPRIASAVARALAEKRTYKLEHRIRRKDGEERIVCEHAHVVFDAKRRPTRIIGAVQDITERKQAERALRLSEERLRLAQVGANVGVWEWTPSTGEVVFSPELNALHGLAPGTLRSYEDWLERVHPDDRSRLLAERDRAIEEGAGFQIEFRVAHASGEVRWIVTRGKAVYDDKGTVSRVLGVSIDITERRRYEEDLRRANEKLLETDRRRTEFLAVLSHELRNPLAPIRNSLYIVEQLARGGPQVEQALRVIDRQTRQLTRLIDDLLDVTRVARGKVQLRRETLDLSDIVRRTAEDHREVFARNGIELTVSVPEEPIGVDGDRARLMQVIGNLLHNAAKFTPPGGHAAVSVLRRGRTATITVRDDGTGIAADTLESLFEPFMQAEHSLDRARGGLGVGLALVKSLVELHGGTVRAASDGTGRGAEFVVELPAIDRVVSSHEAPAAAAGSTRRPRRVLVIEDNLDTAETLRQALELDGNTVEVALNGHDGVEKAKAFGPEVVFCDIGLPGIDGYEVARQLRADARLRHTRLVALTGYALQDDLEQSRAAGFDLHMAKPPDFAALQQVLDAADGGSRDSGAS